MNKIITQLHHISESFRQDEFKGEPAERTKVREHGRDLQNSLVSSFLKYDVPEIKLVGITVRTSNAVEFNLDTAKIGATMQKFFGGLQDKILNRKNPGKVFAVYTNYESDASGKYTYFLGEEVTSFENINKDFETLTIPVQTYAKFTPNPGQMPSIVIDMWQKIWSMDSADFGGERAYIADFEIYDERSMNPNNAILDIYIGIKN